MGVKQVFIPKYKFILAINDQRITEEAVLYYTEYFDDDFETRSSWFTEAKLFEIFTSRQTKNIFDNFRNWYIYDRYYNAPDYFQTHFNMRLHNSITPYEFRLVPDLKYFRRQLLVLLHQYIDENKFTFNQGFMDNGLFDRLLVLLGFWENFKIICSERQSSFLIYDDIITFKTPCENNGTSLRDFNLNSKIHCLVSPYTTYINSIDRSRPILMVIQFADSLVYPNYGLLTVYPSRGLIVFLFRFSLKLNFFSQLKFS